jgi:TolB-like protein
LTAAPDSVADADSVTSDIIFGFAKLRSFSVIARGTAFSLRSLTPAAAAALVNAQYVASGHLRRDGKRYIVSVELVDPKSDRILWVDEYSCNADDSFAVPPLLAARIITGLDAEIHVIERNRALLMPPASLGPASQATAIERLSTSSTGRLLSTRPSREAMRDCRSRIFTTRFI